MNNVYLALDFPTWNETELFLTKHELQGIPVKVGMELFYREGAHIIHKLKANDHVIFLDLKLHDIPNTVKRAMENLAQLEIDLINVHALGGRDMIYQAKNGLITGSSQGKLPQLIAVTVLTSFTNAGLAGDLLVNEPINDYTVHLAKFAMQSGADGVVSSAREANAIKRVCGKQFLTVTPGIRPASTTLDDQKRIATPQFARQNGSSAIVVGRPVTNAKQPKEIYNKIVKEWQNEANYRTELT